MLYLVATPIGNLGDITHRALEILKTCDLLLCEDTRHSQILLHHYGIHRPAWSFHLFNESAREERVIQELQAGKQVALISDAGTPGIADPGERLIQRCIAEGITVVPIPGPCAAIAALIGSGLKTEPFQFVGFLPRQEGSLQKKLLEILRYPGTTICYESPRRLHKVLHQIQRQDPLRQLVVARELTKKFEEYERGTAEQLLQKWGEEIKGEVILLISQDSRSQNEEWALLSPEVHVTWLMETYGISSREAIKMAAELRGVPKREIYQAVIHPSQEA